MNGIYEIKNLSYEIDPDTVLRTLRCGKDNPQRAEMEAEFRQLKGLAETLLSPVGILGFGMLPDSKRPVVYMVTGVGGAVSEQVTDYFKKGDYVRGMILDAMADHALFSLEKPMLKALRERCAEQRIGVAARLEAPEEVPMSIQRTAWEYLELEKRFGIAISGNTTMVHLLMGYDCSTLGVFPFTPVNLDIIHIGGGRLLGKIFQNMAVTILPGISTYVGGDITAGLYACGFWQTDETALLVDLGTNGEMAVGNRARIWAASTAAGPAFEGGNISCGMGSVPGAIFSVRLADNLPTAPNTGLPRIKTIGGQPPLGLCGTGVIETAAELFQHHIIDENGSMKPEYFDAGFPIAAAPSGRPIAFTRRDVREIQLAKAAIRAGIETLLLESHITKEEISAVWLAGGFSQSLDVKKAVSIGLFPPEWENCIRPVGNTSLAGAAAFLQTDQAEETLKRLVSVSGEVVISGSAAFQDLYLKHLNFGA